MRFVEKDVDCFGFASNRKLDGIFWQGLFASVRNLEVTVFQGVFDSHHLGTNEFQHILNSTKDFLNGSFSGDVGDLTRSAVFDVTEYALDFLNRTTRKNDFCEIGHATVMVAAELVFKIFDENGSFFQRSQKINDLLISRIFMKFDFQDLFATEWPFLFFSEIRWIFEKRKIRNECEGVFHPSVDWNDWISQQQRFLDISEKSRIISGGNIFSMLEMNLLISGCEGLIWKASSQAVFLGSGKKSRITRMSVFRRFLFVWFLKHLVCI
ncbi:MAG: hypothetical protein WCO97_09160 [bacterium]